MLSKTKQTGIRLTCKAFPSLGSAELEKSTAELDAARTTAKTLAMQLKSSRYAKKKDEYSVYADLRNRVETSQAARKKVLTSIGEDMRALSRDTELLRFRQAMTHTEDWNQIPDQFSTRNVVLDLNYNESAALIDAHVKRCKLRNEADIVVPQSSTDWNTRSATGATSPVKEHDQYNSRLMYSTTEGIESAVFKAQGKMVEISMQQTVSCDTTDDGCNGGNLLTVFNYAMDAESIDCDVDYMESSNGGCGGSGDYYGYYYGSEQALR